MASDESSSSADGKQAENDNDATASSSVTTKTEEGKVDAEDESFYCDFKDESTECAICLGSLNDPDMEVIELTTCGHRWHLLCLQEQLTQAQPNPAQRLVLTGCRCAKCGVVCNHPKLKHLTRRTDALIQRVNDVLKEQLNVSTEEQLEQARSKYAVYLCSNCQEPYFGGTIACADTVDGEVPPDERLCVACAPSRLTHLQCHHPLEHKAYHAWKCRYCCRVATHVCYGTVHFCQACHDRNSERVAILQQQQLIQRRRGRYNVNAKNEPPPCLTAIPCPGGDACPFPKPAGQTHHQNGPTATCEQVYYCGWCQSNPNNEHAFVEPPGSRNLLRNASGQEGPRVAWNQLNPRAHWQVETSDTPLNEAVTTNFVSTFQWCVMAQSVPLYRFVRNPSFVRVELSAKYMGRTDCPSVFRMEGIILNAQRRPIARQATRPLPAPADFWERTSLTFEPTRGAHEIIVVVHGKDERFWQGNFGSKVTDCKVRILGEPDELEEMLLPDNDVQQGAVADRLQRRNVGGLGGEEPQQRNRLWRTLILEGVLPVVCLILLAWLLQ